MKHRISTCYVCKLIVFSLSKYDSISFQGLLMLEGGKGGTTSGMFVKNKVAFDRSININPIGLTLIAFFALGFIYFMFGSFSFGEYISTS